MKVVQEEIKTQINSSFTVKCFRGKKVCKYSYWHHHPEYEIIFIAGGNGTIQAGSHFSFFSEGQLVLLGPNIPHFGLNTGFRKDYEEIIVQVNPVFFESNFFGIPEMKSIMKLLELAKSGILFKKDTRIKAGKILHQLHIKRGFERVQCLLSVLNEMSLSEDYQVLDSTCLSFDINSKDQMRIRKVFDYVEINYKELISMSDLASLVNLTIPSFCRFFKKNTAKTFTQFINEYRIAKACELLSQSMENISEIGYEVGYNNLSHFNKQFKTITFMSPKKYQQYIFSNRI